MPVEPSPAPKHIIVFCNCGSEAEAEGIAKSLVERRLAACVNIVQGVQSLYRWQGKLTSSVEWMLTAKTTLTRFEEVREAIEASHSYQVPEIIALPIFTGSSAYLNWIDDSVHA